MYIILVPLGAERIDFCLNGRMNRIYIRVVKVKRKKGGEGEGREKKKNGIRRKNFW